MPGEVSRSYYPCDSEVVALAKLFLDDDPKTKGGDPRELSEAIQRAIEDWFLENASD